VVEVKWVEKGYPSQMGLEMPCPMGFNRFISSLNGESN